MEISKIFPMPGTVLQHLLAHESEVLTLLLHYQAPFVPLRALNRPGCSEVLQILLGPDLREEMSLFLLVF